MLLQTYWPRRDTRAAQRPAEPKVTSHTWIFPVSVSNTTPPSASYNGARYGGCAQASELISAGAIYRPVNPSQIQYPTHASTSEVSLIRSLVQATKLKHCFIANAGSAKWVCLGAESAIKPIGSQWRHTIPSKVSELYAHFLFCPRCDDWWRLWIAATVLPGLLLSPDHGSGFGQGSGDQGEEDGGDQSHGGTQQKK